MAQYNEIMSDPAAPADSDESHNMGVTGWVFWRMTTLSCD
jgi:hypothetical protein